MAVLLLILAFLRIPSDELVDFVDEVEVNTFGVPPAVRTAIIYRARGEIIDWRWYTDANQIPTKIALDRYCATWIDQGQFRTVLCRRAPVYTRTKLDVELEERRVLSHDQRTKLSTRKKR